MEALHLGGAVPGADRDIGAGRQVYVEGRLETSEYTDKEGVKKYSTEIVANDIQFLDSKGGGGGEGGGGYSRGGRGGSGGGGGESGGPSGGGRGSSEPPPDDDIPF